LAVLEQRAHADNEAIMSNTRAENPSRPFGTSQSNVLSAILARNWWAIAIRGLAVVASRLSPNANTKSGLEV
jgi:hypothetical protein